MIELDVNQQKIADLKSQGKTNREIAKIVYPQQKLRNAEVLVSRQIRKPNVAKYIDKGKEYALIKYNMTWNRIIAKLEYFLDGDNENLQFQALRTLISLLPDKIEPTNKQDNKELIAAINSKVDDVELQRIVFKKNEPTTKN
jgi:hypothetical protein